MTTGSISGITFGGLASGIDTKSLITQLLALEARPINALNTRKTVLARQKTLFAELETKLTALKSAADALRTTSKFLDTQAAFDETGFFTATTTTGAQAGSFDIAVSALAKAQVSTSLGKADKDTTAYGTGQIQITVGTTTKNVTIDTSNNTLQGIAAAINNGDAGVTAVVVDTGAPTDPYKLVLTGKNGGTANGFTIATSPASSPLLASLASEVAGNLVTGASNASLTVNGVPVSRASNVINDVISGVTITLTGVHTPANTDTILTVSTDPTKVGDKVKKMVDAYNEVVNFVEAQGKVDTTGKTTSALFGDSTLSSIRNSLRAKIGSSISTGSEAYALLSQVGITSDKKGILTFDAAKFKTALEGGEDYTKALFTQAGTGIAQSLYATASGYTDSTQGFLKTRKDGIDLKQKDLDTQIRRGEDRLKASEASLTARFARLEELLSKLQSQGKALSAF